MAKENDIIETKTGKEFIITRVFDAPRELVFKVFSKAEHLDKWWGPKGSAIHVSKLDFHAGGIFHYSLEFPDGLKIWGRFIYRETIAPERIVFVSSFSDEDGNIAGTPFGGTFPLEILNVITLAETGGKTTLTLRAVPINATDEEHNAFQALFESMQQGYGGTFDKLDDYLAEF